MIWPRGHKNDWEYFAAEADDPGWSYESVLGLRTGRERQIHGDVARVASSM
jgi:hypothetical protein